MPKFELNKRVLVTGGSGFLGSHLCERLISEGAQVICVDNFYSSSKSNVSHLDANPNFELIRHDTTFPLYVEVDEIFNLACPASPIHYQHDPVQTTKTSVIGAINMLGLAKRTGARIFQASTSEIYGDPTESPQTESYWGNVNPIGPRACYDEGKRCAETLFFDYQRQHGVDVRVARIFNTFGARMHPNDGRVVSNFVTQAIKNEPITIYGDGTQTRSFCYVDDLIDAFIKFMQVEGPVKAPLNLGNPSEVQIQDLARLILDLTGSTSQIINLPCPEDDPKQRKPDISEASKALDWKPQITLSDGLERTIAYFRSHYAR